MTTQYLHFCDCCTGQIKGLVTTIEIRSWETDESQGRLTRNQEHLSGQLCQRCLYSISHATLLAIGFKEQPEPF